MTLELNKIYHGNNLSLIKQLDENCIDLTVTSPPYDNLRTYNGTSPLCHRYHTLRIPITRCHTSQGSFFCPESSTSFD